MPLPDPNRVREYGLKAAHVALRLVNRAPEQRRARQLASQHHEPPPQGPPHVVILTPRDWSAQVNWEALIGHALRVRGARVSYITCGGGLEICDRANHWEAPPMPCRSCTGYVESTLDAHGFSTFPLRHAWEGGDSEPWIALDAVPFNELHNVTDERGVALGELTDIPLKWFLMTGSIDDDPLAPLTWRRFLRSGERVSRALERRLDELKPDVVLLLNGLFFFESIAWELCRRRAIDVVTYERGFRPGTLVFRRDVAACMMDLTPQWSETADLPLTTSDREAITRFLTDRGLDLDARPRVVDGAAAGRRVALFTNLTWDSAVIGQGRAFPSLRDWIAAAVEFFAGRSHDELVIRIHPAEVVLPGKQSREYVESFLSESFPALPRNVRVIPPTSQESSYELMKWCDVGLVFTSTTGLELAAMGRPVLVSGETHYRGKGFTIDIDSADGFTESMETVLANPENYVPDRERALKYAKLLFLDVPLEGVGLIEPVPGLAEIVIDDIGQVAPGVDPVFDAVCDGILHGGDFLVRAPRAKRG